MYANQKLIVTNKDMNLPKDNIFTSIPVKGVEQAINHLSSSALRVYLYIAKNQNHYQFGLSKADFCNICRTYSKSTYYTGVNELIEEGYLVKYPKRKNLYVFTCYSKKCEDQDIFYDKMHPSEDSEEKDSNLSIEEITEEVQSLVNSTSYSEK